MSFEVILNHIAVDTEQRQRYHCELRGPSIILHRPPLHILRPAVDHNLNVHSHFDE